MLLLFNVGDPDAALKALRRAQNCYWRCRDFVGLGKTLVDEGVVLGTSGDYEQAISTYESALSLLRDDAIEHRYGALVGIAVAAVYLGDVKEARRRLDQALAALGNQTSGLYHATGVLWLMGEIALLLEQHGDAADHFLGVWDRYIDLDMGPLEITLISLRIAKAYFLQGDRPRLRQILRDMISGLGEVERSNRLLGTALGEFLREDARGQITAEALEEIYRKMRAGTGAAPPLLPAKLPTTPRKA